MTWTRVTIHRHYGGKPNRLHVRMWLLEHIGIEGNKGDWYSKSEKPADRGGLLHHYYFKDSRKAVMFKLVWAGQ